MLSDAEDLKKKFSESAICFWISAYNTSNEIWFWLPMQLFLFYFTLCLARNFFNRFLGTPVAVRIIKFSKSLLIFQKFVKPYSIYS